MIHDPGNDDTQAARHPIRVVAQRTGLTPDLLRAWEKRYGVVEPERSETGQRLYSDADVDRLQLLRRATEGGRSIGSVAPLTVADLAALVEEDEGHRRNAERKRIRAAGDEGAEHLEAALESVRRLEAGELDAVLVKAALRLGSAVFLEHVAVPLLREIGDAWHRDELGVAHEHLASSATQRVLGWLLWSGTPNREGPSIVIGTLSGQRHELGALLCSAVAAEEGWRVVYLGGDLPAEELARAVSARQATVVALSMVYPPGEPRIAAELRKLRTLLPEVRIVVGGSSAGSYSATLSEIGAVWLAELSALRPALADLVPERVSLLA
jgi:DNA-binding transcriptional MerR regulator/methylmalonyl-CoA mutase cobalamin-binding subunit